MNELHAYRKKPRILVVTPECASLPVSMGRTCAHPFSSGGGTGEAMADIVSRLYEEKVDVHLAFPDYCAVLRRRIDPEFIQECGSSRIEINQRLHRAQDRIFYHAGNDNPVDLMTSGVFCASWVHFFSAGLLGSLLEGRHPAAGPAIRQELADKIHNRHVAAIPPPSGPSLSEPGDTSPARRFTPFFNMVRLYETALGRSLFPETQPSPAEPVKMMQSA